MRVWLFNVGEKVVVNQLAINGLPNDVGKLVEVTEQLEHGSYDYRIKIKDGTTKVRESELNKVNEDDIIMKIKVGDSIVRGNDTEAKIVLIDYLYRQVEIEYPDNTYEVISVEKFIEKSDVVCQ